MADAFRCFRFLRFFRFLAAAVLIGLGTLAPAQAAGLLEKNLYLSGQNYDGVLPPCEAALGKIAARFAEKEGRFWNSDLQILDFERVREIAFRPWVAGDHSASLLQRGRRGQRRAQAPGELLDRRGHRHDRHDLGRRMVRGRPRPQLGLQPPLQDGAALKPARF